MHTAPTVFDHNKRLTQQISTGLCIFWLIVSMVFPVYLSLMSVTNTITIRTPTVATYLQLYSANPEMLTCSCSKPSIPYEKFIHMQCTFHQICSSIFVTQYWISYLAMSNATKFSYDFRTTSPSSFQALTMFCDLIQTAITDNLSRFYSSQYVSVSVTPSVLFEAQMQSSIQQFISSTTNSFLLSLSMIRGTIQSNALLSGLQTNYKQMVQNGDVSLLAQKYYWCDCASSAKCIFPSAIYNYPSVTSLFNVPGFYTGCYVIESLLQSNLQCFFNQTCIDKLQTYLSSSTSMPVTALNPLVASQYVESSTIHELLDHLMVEQWDSSIMYNSYYQECQPTQCTYNVKTRNDVTYIVTMSIAVIGSLTAILNLIVPQLVRLIVNCVRKRETRAMSEMPVVQT